MDEELRWMRPPAAAAFVRKTYGLPMTGTQMQSWCRDGLLGEHGVGVMRIGNRYFIDRDGLARWIEERIRESGVE